VKRRGNLLGLGVVLSILAVFFVLYRGGYSFPWGAEYISFIPVLLLLGAGAQVAATSWGTSRFGGFFAVGLGMAVLVERLNELGVLVPGMLSTSIGVTTLQFLVFLVCVVVGVFASF